MRAAPDNGRIVRTMKGIIRLFPGLPYACHEASGCR